MAFFYEQVAKRLLFQLDPERAHELTVHALAWLGKVGPLCRRLESYHKLSSLVYRPVRAFDLEFPNAVGLAAGFDKNAEAWPAAAALGFGHVEIGTVTAGAQEGNPKPRLFRYPAEEAVINRMGFNNQGAVAVAARLARQPRDRRIPLGINIGKSKVATIDRAVDDYLESFRLLADHADYIAINVSSPNTPDLRKLQEKDRLEIILRALIAANAARTVAGRPRRPLLLKIAPDLSFRQVDEVLEILLALRLDGIIATNTTLARPGAFAAVNQAGGLSGAPVRRMSTEMVRYIARATNGRLPIVGVGGIVDGSSAAEKLDAGATLVQVYTGMIYRGPLFARDLAWALADRQRR